MNKVILMGRLTRDPVIRTSEGQQATKIARFTLAVDRRGKKTEGRESADFPSCVAFGHSAEFTEKYLSQGKRIIVTGRIQTGSYTNKDGVKVYTTEVICEEIEFAESKEAEGGQQAPPMPSTDADGFMTIPDGIDEELPFS